METSNNSQVTQQNDLNRNLLENIKYDAIDFNKSLDNLEFAMREFDYCADLVFENKFNDALNYSKQKSEYSLYHSSMKSSVSFLKAFMTLKRSEIMMAKNDIQQTLELTRKCQKTSNIFTGISHIFWKENFDQILEYQLHAELISAEIHLIFGFLMIFAEQSFMAAIKSAFAIRNANQSLKYCEEILKNRTVWDSEFSKCNFESGLYMGLGLMELMISMIPEKFLKLLSVFGFSGDRNKANEYLFKSLKLKNGLRFRVAAMVYLSFTLFFEQMIGIGEENYELMNELIDEIYSKFPNSTIILFFKGKISMVDGNIDNGIKYLNESMYIQEDFLQIRTLIKWELFFCYSLIQEWCKAAEMAKGLIEDNPFSKATNYYRFVCVLHMQMKTMNNQELKGEIDNLMKLIPTLKVKYGGKTLPQEKFVCTRAQQYSLNENKLIAPIYEFLYLWNALHVKKNSKISETILKDLDDELNYVDNCNFEYKNDYHNRLLLLKGVILRKVDKAKEAIECFQEILKNEKLIIKDNYIPPHAALEIGLTYLKICDYKNAEIWLKTVSDYKEFLVEALVQLRVHNGLRIIKNLAKK